MSVAGVSSITHHTIADQLQVSMPYGKENSTEQLPHKLTPEEEKQVEKLKKRDAEVRRHEQAHLNAAGGYARSGTRFEYEAGPDGKRYAIGGEVSLDISPAPNNPEATITKAQIIERAALAPEKPSSQDYRIAAQAEQMELHARRELARERTEQLQTYNHNGQSHPPINEPIMVDFSI